MKCPKCGRENVPGTPFCADCGKSLFSDDAPAASESQAQSQPVDVIAAQAVQVMAQDVEPERAEAAASVPAEDVVPTPIITDGAIYIGPVTDAEPEAEPESAGVLAPEPAAASAPEPEPIAAPEPEAASVTGLRSETVAEPEAVAASAQETEAITAAAAEAAESAVPVAASEPIPDPEPAGKFEGAFANPPEAETQMVADEVAQHEAGAAQQTADSQAPVEGPDEASTPSPVAPDAAVPAAEAASSAAEAAAPASEAASPEAEGVPASGSEPEPAPQFAPFATDAPIVPPNPARAHQTYPAPGGEVLYKKGCLAAAWDDITGSKNWFGKILLLGLVYCVPILNFYVLGYAMRWSRELFLGKVASMPERIFGNRMFVNGFFAFVIQLVLGIVVSVCGFILDFIPFIGALCYIALAVLVSAFEYLAVMRAAVADRLGAGFDVSQIWNTGKRNFGALCCATIVPSLIVGAIMVVIVMAIGLIMCIPLMGSVAEVASASAYSYHSDAYMVGQLFSVMLIMLPMFLVMYVICSFVSAFLTLLVMRATGHYVARYAQDWKQEQAVMSTAHINGV